MVGELADLASRALGASVVWANDEFFAARDNLINAAPPAFSPRTFSTKGQVYDGWETRRRRDSGHDDAIVRLGVCGLVHEVVVDTTHFTGNFPPEASLEGCRLPGYPSPAELAAAPWFSLIERSTLVGDAPNRFPAAPDRLVTHVRLCIYPDGGVARLRIHGEAVVDPELVPDVFDLAAAEYGARVVDCSDRFYGAPDNLLLPGLAATMGEGWETRRRRDGGNDWVQVALAATGVVQLVELDTSHFKGNAPGWAQLTGETDQVLMPRTRLQPDTRHRFRLDHTDPISSVRLDIYPDGGLARLRLYGMPTAAARERLAQRWADLWAGQ